jgi:hypothetical protein
LKKGSDIVTSDDKFLNKVRTNKTFRARYEEFHVEVTALDSEVSIFPT